MVDVTVEMWNCWTVGRCGVSFVLSLVVDVTAEMWNCWTVGRCGVSFVISLLWLTSLLRCGTAGL